jgi:hypothetical protein
MKRFRSRDKSGVPKATDRMERLSADLGNGRLIAEVQRGGYDRIEHREYL